CFGSPNIRTPNFDRLASEGIQLRANYVGAPVCGPSRAALMTGSYPIRIAEPKNNKHLHTHLHEKEITLPELLKGQGYATALLGKWHLGGSPNAHGFDYFFGTPAYNGYTKLIEEVDFRASIMRNQETVIKRVEQAEMDQLTTMYTEEALQFIDANKDQPFFLLLSHNMPHVPLGVSDKFRGKSKAGLYGDVIEELDWSLGQVMGKLKELGLDDNTLVVFLSDNGPWIEEQIGDHAGHADPLRGAKMLSWEGGPRVPCIMRWPNQIPAGQVVDQITTAMDLLPTFSDLADAPLPEGIGIDGKNIFPFVSGKTKQSPHDVYFYYTHTHLHAVRDKQWKLVLPRPAKPEWMSWWARMVDGVKTVQLYDLKNDIGETTNLADKHPEVVERLLSSIEDARRELGDCDRIGNGARFYDKNPKRRDIRKYKAWLSKQVKR
ncbi:MAG: sulfatase family protein, partial [Opitutales bacterium]